MTRTWPKQRKHRDSFRSRNDFSHQVRSGRKLGSQKKGTFEKLQLDGKGKPKGNHLEELAPIQFRRANSNGLRKKLLEARASESGEGGDILHESGDAMKLPQVQQN